MTAAEPVYSTCSSNNKNQKRIRAATDYGSSPDPATEARSYRAFLNSVTSVMTFNPHP